MSKDALTFISLDTYKEFNEAAYAVASIYQSWAQLCCVQCLYLLSVNSATTVTDFPLNFE
jgi:hypothetical protein